MSLPWTETKYTFVVNPKFPQLAAVPEDFIIVPGVPIVSAVFSVVYVNRSPLSLSRFSGVP